jgi:hypothetical protein
MATQLMRGSAADAVAEVHHPVGLIDGRRGQLRRRLGRVVEEPDPSPKQHRNQVQADLVEMPAARLWRTMSAPPPIAMSLPPAAARAWSRALSSPSGRQAAGFSLT